MINTDDRIPGPVHQASRHPLVARSVPWLVLLTLSFGCFGCHWLPLSAQEVAKPQGGAKPDAAGDRDAAPKAKHAAPKAKPNRLLQETSPYLLQHAHNPVDWRPWGPEALAAAKKDKKPILLSIGYSSCHWCHVMEKESFLDDEIAKVLNEHYVCIKIDREERPDIDKIYMTSLQIFLQLSGAGGNGGWPLTMFLTPEAKPFFGGSYFPARDGDRGMTTGFLTIITRVAKIWNESPDRIQQDAEVLTRFTKQQLEAGSFDPSYQIDDQYAALVQAALAKDFDAKYGGFGYDPDRDQRPKFPEPSNLFFLIHRLRELPTDSSNKELAKQRADAEHMLHTTLQGMAMGGIRDHLGGGFHRYSVDRRWNVPHFEKMLYDNGLLATAYAEAYALAPKPSYRRVLNEMAEFLRREMTHQGGAFLAALDADSEGEEGKFYRWTRKEVQEVLSDEEYQLAAPALGLDGPPNFEGPNYALRQSRPPAELAKQAGLSEEAWAEAMSPIRAQLLKHRAKRVRPGDDFKVLTAWNGLMIRGLADSGRVLKQPAHIEMAARAADFVLANLRREDGQLVRSYAKGQAKLNAYLDDYAYLVHGLIGLHKATGDARWLAEAKRLTDIQSKMFWDERGKGFYFTASDHESLLARSRNQVDGARPSGNSVAANNLLYLADQLKEEQYRARARETIQAAAELLQKSPAAVPNMAVAIAILAKK